MSLKETTSFLMRAPDVVRWLNLADSHIQAYNRLQGQFVLPAEHKILAPIIEAFATDTRAFAAYIRVLRDAAEAATYDGLHELYRKVDLRALQVERRTRIRRAVLLALPALEQALGRAVPYQQQIQVATFIEQQWGAMRLAHVAAARSLHAKDRLPAEERNTALLEFWQGIDKALDSGVVPLSDEGALGSLVEQLGHL